MLHGDRLETLQSDNGSMLMKVDMDIMSLEATAPQKGNSRYQIARRRDTLYRTQYNTHNNFTTVTHGIKKENRTYTTYMGKTST
jgi:hypothetical protein